MLRVASLIVLAALIAYPVAAQDGQAALPAEAFDTPSDAGSSRRCSDRDRPTDNQPVAPVRRTGPDRRARYLLRPLIDAFTEEADTADVRDAATLQTQPASFDSS